MESVACKSEEANRLCSDKNCCFFVILPSYAYSLKKQPHNCSGPNLDQVLSSMMSVVGNKKTLGKNHEFLCEELLKKFPYTQARKPGNVFLGSIKRSITIINQYTRSFNFQPHLQFKYSIYSKSVKQFMVLLL